VTALPEAEAAEPQQEEITTPPPPLDEAQFGLAFRQGYPMTLRFLLSRGARTETAEEIAQAAWAKGWECRWQLQRPAMIGAWVNSIAKNMLKNRVRAEQKLEGLSEYANPASPFLLSVDVKRILNRCDQRDSKILRGYYLEGYTSEEIAQQVGLTPVGVRVRLLRIRRTLRSHFADVNAAA
jgi:RNA polymerase sigma factor (sigma-70 family)